MAKINTTNYQPVTAWNGTQDLLIVEQPDGTKVATPEQVKQYVEAGDFEATGEIIDGHGNILKDMAKSADVDAEIGDLSQTGLTGDSVADQLGAAKGEIGDLSQTTVTGDTVAAQLKSIKKTITYNKVPDSFITLQSGISIVTNQLYKQGNHIFGWITFGFSAQTPTALTLGVLNSGYRPNGYIRMMVGFGTQPWSSEYVGYSILESDYSIIVIGYNANIKAAHIHLDYVV